ncbi:uncharacterized protein LOC130796156 [Actinidia eriantha]|uniref:uncharacterized protein LOC130796156 n=1 Tax=Actinidia eriantha TaxID=165200 RepID=UPI002584FD4E|nr:uncharacterized protein LOC130796156 [Actinidia eriantha]
MAITKPLSKKNKTMKKKLELEDHDDHDLEILKAVAQAWHGHSGSSRTANEFDALRLNFKPQPTRFNLEATNKAPAKKDTHSRAHWDFGLSLWDSFEIVSVSKRLEAGLVLDHQFPELDDLSLRIKKRGTESDNSLRNLFNRLSSRRYNEAEIPRHEGEDVTAVFIPENNTSARWATWQYFRGWCTCTERCKKHRIF